MNILLISDYNAPYAGNFIESVKELNKYLKKNKDKMCYLFPNRCKTNKYLDDLEEISENTVNFFKDDTILSVYKKLKKIYRENKINIIYCHFCRHKTQIAIKLFCITHKKVKLVSHFHNHCKTSKSIIKSLFYKLGYKFYKGNLNIGCSKSVMESMPYKQSIKTYIDNAINFKRLDNFRKIDISDKRKYVVLMFGFNFYRKGIDLAIKAIKEMDQDITLAISIASNIEKIEKYIREEYNEIPEFIKFLDPIEDIGSYYRGATIFLSAAREEGFCYSLVEAAYCNVKIISSNIGGVPKNIPGELLFESENYKDLSETISKSLNTRNDLQARKYVIENYGMENWVKNIYLELKKMI